MNPNVSPQNVACPDCSAKIGQQCMLSRTALGTGAVHVSRLELAEREAEHTEDKRQKKLSAILSDFEKVKAARESAKTASDRDYSHKVAMFSSEAGSFINKHFAALEELLGIK